MILKVRQARKKRIIKSFSKQKEPKVDKPMQEQSYSKFNATMRTLY